MVPEQSPPEVLMDDEPRYLRRQRPIEIRRRKFGRRALPLFKRISLAGIGIVSVGWVSYSVAHFFLFSLRMMLRDPQQIELKGNRFVGRQAVIGIFARDRGRSILRVPLAERRSALEGIPWVEQAVIRRVLPNRLQVELIERTPVAFLRTGTDLALVDAHGVILERPLEGQFAFPVVAGLSEQMPREERERRMALFVELLKGLEAAKPRSSQKVSEADLSDANDLRATLADMSELSGQGPVLVHFGDGDFRNKFRLFVENIAQWRASAGRVDSVDLRFSREVVVNPERP